MKQKKPSIATFLSDNNRILKKDISLDALLSLKEEPIGYEPDNSYSYLDEKEKKDFELFIHSSIPIMSDKLNEDLNNFDKHITPPKQKDTLFEVIETHSHASVDINKMDTYKAFGNPLYYINNKLIPNILNEQTYNDLEVDWNTLQTRLKLQNEKYETKIGNFVDRVEKGGAILFRWCTIQKTIDVFGEEVTNYFLCFSLNNDDYLYAAFLFSFSDITNENKFLKHISSRQIEDKKQNLSIIPFRDFNDSMFQLEIVVENRFYFSCSCIS